jgi:hypothetical protein
LNEGGIWSDIGIGWVEINSDTIFFMFDEDTGNENHFKSKLSTIPDLYQLEGGFKIILF